MYHAIRSIANSQIIILVGKIKIRLGKANAILLEDSNVWKSKELKLKVKIRLHESLVFATLKYGSDTWSMTVRNKKK